MVHLQVYPEKSNGDLPAGEFGGAAFAVVEQAFEEF
jgi:hypothetical protein